MVSSTQFKFAGNLINTLSSDIPSFLFALNELIKNSYDAFSPDVKITIDQDKEIITISDHGSGMGKIEIDSLFHIAKSTKEYGQRIEKNGQVRLTQGSKGLGFLAALKFGNEVEWVTCKDGYQSTFSVDKSNLLATSDLSKMNIPIKTERSSEKGTIIKIKSNKEGIDTLLSKTNLGNDIALQKIAAAIKNKGFNITIEINSDKVLSTTQLKDFRDEEEDKQLFYVEYSSSKGEIDFYHQGDKIGKSIPFSLERKEYSIELKLIIFFFGQGGKAKNISPLYRKTSKSQNSNLCPLLYINEGLFNNPSYFDPDINRSKRTDLSLPQMIGQIDVICADHRLQFNSDRTQFVENKLTEDIINDLANLNSLIQEEGSKLRQRLQKDKETLLTSRASPSQISQEKEENQNIGKKTASICINKNKQTIFHIPSDQIDLDEYILKVTNSSGQEVNKNEVIVTIDGIKSDNRIIPSVEHPCTKEIYFRYTDRETGLVTGGIDISFQEKRAPIRGTVSQSSPLFIQSNKSYKVRLAVVRNLIQAMNTAYSSSNRKVFLPLIACSIRSVFEICSDEVFKHFDPRKDKESRKIRDISSKVGCILILFRKNKELISHLSAESDINFNTLRKQIIPTQFIRAVESSHIGAHQSNKFLSSSLISDMAKSCGFFAVMCDIFIRTDKNELSKICQEMVEPCDLDEIKQF